MALRQVTGFSEELTRRLAAANSSEVHTLIHSMHPMTGVQPVTSATSETAKYACSLLFIMMRVQDYQYPTTHALAVILLHARCNR